MLTVDQATEVFVHAFASIRSITYPYLVSRFDDVYAMQDAPRKSGDRRKDEFVTCRADAESAHSIALRERLGRHHICTILGEGQDDRPVKAAYKALGYRLTTTENFFVHTLENIEPVECGFAIERIVTEERLAEFHAVTRTRQMLPRHLTENPPTFRQYIALEGNQIVGWVKSVAAQDAHWCSNMFVAPAYRRKGIAKALMTRMLLDDKAAGSGGSVLLASRTGSLLYPLLGYQNIGQLFAFVMKR